MITKLGGLAARAIFIATRLGTRNNAEDYRGNAVTAINVLQDSWYNVQTGIWDEAWWNSANALTTLAEFAGLDRDTANELNIGGIIKNTFYQAQQESVAIAKHVNAAGVVTSSYSIHLPILEDQSDNKPSSINIRDAYTSPGFINEFYDDEGWWTLGLIRAYDVTGDQEYLDMAASIFEDMRTGGDTHCGGGIYWNKDRKYVNAVTNELFLSAAAGLANRMPNRTGYLGIALEQWSWFKGSGLINDRGTINDGLDGYCKNNGDVVWSYNQGVVLGGLIELHRATGNDELLVEAADIARAGIEELSDDDGILHDVCEPECGADGEQFKGIFVRNLRYLQDALPRDEFRTFILENANSIWKNNRNEKDEMGVNWSGPAEFISGPSHSSALDAIVGAMAVI